MNNARLPEIEISYSIPSRQGMLPIRTSKGLSAIVCPVFEDRWIEYQERFFAFYFTTANILLGYCHISSGGPNATVVHIGQVMGIAAKANATGIAVAHNHPSGNLKFSQSDTQLTEKIVGACRLLDITFLDHLLVVKGGYLSIRDEGLV